VNTVSGFHKMLESSSVAAQLAASRERLISKKLELLVFRHERNACFTSFVTETLLLKYISTGVRLDAELKRPYVFVT
jgi:hypothetical protein